MIRRGRHLTFSKDDLRRLGQELKRIVDAMEVQYADMMEEIKKQWSRYEAEKATERKSFPFDGASNVVIPLVQIHVDATAARYLLLIKPETNTWVARSQNDDFVRTGLLKEVPAFLNWAAVSDFDLPSVLPDWVLETVNVGSGVIGLDWDRQVVNVVGEDNKPTEVVLREGPLVRHIPRENILWDTNYPVWAAPVVVEKKLLTWQDIVLHANESWDWEEVEKFKGQTVAATSDEVRRELEERTGKDSQGGPTDYALYDIRRIWIDWPVAQQGFGISPPEEMEKGDVLATMVVDLHRESATVADVTAAPYAIAGKPYYSAFKKKRSGQFSSKGLGDSLGDLQEVASTFFNQSSDAVTKANTISGVTSNPDLDDAEFKLNRLIYTPDVKEVLELGKGKNILPDIALMNQVVIFAERLTGINDPALGRETRMGGHPATATTTLQLLQEGKKLDITAINSFRAALRQLGRDVALLYQQLERNQMKVMRAVGLEDGKKVWAWMRGPSALGIMEFDLASVSETMNPQLEQQKAAGIFQFTANFYALVNQYLTVAANPQAPPALVNAMLHALMALQESFKKVLDHGDIDDTSPFLLNINQLVQQISDQRGRAAQAAGGQPGPGGPAGAAAEAAPRRPAIVGSGM